MRYVLGGLLLAALCVGAMELAFCRVAAPQVYEAVTAPAVRLGRAVLTQAGRWWADLSAALAPAEPPEEPQIAGDPAILSDLPAADPAVTELTVVEDREVLTGGSAALIYYNQGDDAWSDCSYGADPIGKYGCGPTAMSMVVSSLTQEALDPEEMAAWAAGEGYCAPRSGSYLSIVQGTADAYGLDCAPLAPTCTAEELRIKLATGGVVVALMGRGHFTRTGHFIVLRGVTLQGDVLVADPNSRENSLAAWDAQLILDELSPSRSSGAPLWLITDSGGL